MKTLTSPWMLCLKAALLVVAGTTSGCLMFVQEPTLMTVALLSTTVWSFCRAYYFAYYVVERYVDPTYRFSGILSLVRYVAWGRRGVAPLRMSQ
jgi:hypothetical protein